jgi:hypothetical protein
VEEASISSPRDELQRFLRSLEDELDQVLDRHPEWFASFWQQFYDAWREVRPYVGEAHDALDPARAQSEEGVSEEDLKRQGLTGAQLKLKMALFDEARDRFHNADRPGGPTGRLRASIRRRFPRLGSLFDRLAGGMSRMAGPAHWFGAFLDVSNTILKSLIGVLPVAEPIREFKDAVKSVVSAF